jgi:sporulation protein YlmC with PRC-barrel domain
MKVYELIELLKEMPQFNTVYLDDGKYLNGVEDVELDDRKYVIIRPL